MLSDISGQTLVVFVWIMAVRIEASGLREELYGVVDRLLATDVYNSRVWPGVHLGIHRQHIFRQRWRDERLAFTEFNETLTLDRAFFNKLWVPDAIFSNEIDGEFNDITVPNRLLHLWPDGSLLYSQRLTLTLGCQMDNQTCGIYIESCKAFHNTGAEFLKHLRPYVVVLNLGTISKHPDSKLGYTTEHLIFNWTAKEAIQMQQRLELPEFVIVEGIVGDFTKTYVTGNFTCLKGSLNLQRQFDYYLISTFIPSSLIVSLSWVSFWIDAHSVPARVSLAPLTVLTITTQSSGIMQTLHKVFYVKAIDIWMTVCLALVYGAMIDFSIVNVLSRGRTRGEKNKKELAEKRTRQEVGRGRIDTSAAQEVGRASQITNGYNAQPHTRPTRCSQLAEDWALGVDMVSRLLFPLFFAIFNIAYWSYFKPANPNL